MKVKELIEKLQTVNQDAYVAIARDSDEMYGIIEELKDIMDAEPDQFSDLDDLPYEDAEGWSFKPIYGQEVSDSSECVCCPDIILLYTPKAWG